MKRLLLLFAFCFLLSCSGKKEEKSEISIGSSFVEKETIFDTILTAESYSKEALAIMYEHKKKLKIILPQIILSEIETYKKTLTEIEKKPVMTYSLEETNISIELERENAGKIILTKEIELNKIYFQLFNELLILNHKYKAILYKKEFKNFYNAGPIVLAEEVMIKIDELVKDEKKRVVAENKKEYQDFAFSFVTCIPVVASLKGILGGITQAAQHIVRDVKLPQSSKLIADVSYKLMNKKVAALIAKTFKNDKIRSNVAKIGYLPIAASPINIGKKASSYLSSEQAGEMFKVLENKINGRIGDFSDGILAVHMQRVRDIIKLNSTMIKQNPSI